MDADQFKFVCAILSYSDSECSRTEKKKNTVECEGFLLKYCKIIWGPFKMKLAETLAMAGVVNKRLNLLETVMFYFLFFALLIKNKALICPIR